MAVAKKTNVGATNTPITTQTMSIMTENETTSKFQSSKYGTQIDDAVSIAHTHVNKTTLDKFGESGGQPTFSGTAIIGQKGERGEQGLQGVPGPIGETGIQGPQGIQGNPGANAVTGFNARGDFSPTATYNRADLVTSAERHLFTPMRDGITGIAPPITFTSTSDWQALIMAGAPGMQGPQGIQGETGSRGLQGIEGPIGLTGPAGAQGPQGEKGERGEQGLPGSPGEKGEKGDPGEQGPQGIQGEQGADGAPGERGDGGGIRQIQTVVPAAGISTFDLSMTNGNIFKVSPTTAITIALTNAVPAVNTLKEFEIHIAMGATAYAVTWFTGLTWLDAIPTFNANKTGVCVFRTVNGTAFQGNLAYEY